MLFAGAPAPDARRQIVERTESKGRAYADVALLQIWNFHELGYQEVKSRALLASELDQTGFTVQRGVAEIPTSFIASFGKNKPVVGDREPPLDYHKWNRSPRA